MMIDFRRIVCIALILATVFFIFWQKDSIISPSGFFTTLAAVFFTAVCVGFIWPDLPPEKDSQDIVK